MLKNTKSISHNHRRSKKYRRLTEHAISLIPFKEDLLNDINVESDFIQFAFLYTWRSDFAMGSQQNINADLFIDYLNRHKICRIISSLEIPKTLEKESSKSLIKLCKYSFCIERLIDTQLMFDGIKILSLFYLLDVLQSWECIFLLINKGFYRQSFQILRGMLEDVVAHTFFALKRNYNPKGKSHNFRTGEKNMLDFLLEKKFIKMELYDRLSKIYSLLSKKSHSNPKVLNNYNFPVNISEYDCLKNWSKITSEAAECILLLLIKMIEIDL